MWMVSLCCQAVCVCLQTDLSTFGWQREQADSLSFRMWKSSTFSLWPMAERNQSGYNCSGFSSVASWRVLSFSFSWCQMGEEGEMEAYVGWKLPHNEIALSPQSWPRKLPCGRPGGWRRRVPAGTGFCCSLLQGPGYTGPTWSHPTFPWRKGTETRAVLGCVTIIPCQWYLSMSPPPLFKFAFTEIIISFREFFSSFGFRCPDFSCLSMDLSDCPGQETDSLIPELWRLPSPTFPPYLLFSPQANWPPHVAVEDGSSSLLNSHLWTRPVSSRQMCIFTGLSYQQLGVSSVSLVWTHFL